MNSALLNPYTLKKAYEYESSISVIQIYYT